MKFLLGIFAIIAFASIYITPYVGKEKACYDVVQKSYDDIGFNSASRGWGIEDVCSARTDALLNLNDCLKSATSEAQLIRYTYPVIDGVVTMVRSVSKGIQTLKSEHNLECSEFYQYQVE